MIRLKYFGMIAENTGKQTELVDFEENVTVEKLKHFLEERYEGLEGLTYKVAVELELIHDETALIPKDAEVALLPAFAGG